MIDSTNPRIMASAIKKLFSKTSAIPIVKGNPTGSGFNTLLTKLQIGTSKYKLPANVTANPEDAASESLSKLGIGSDVFSVYEPVGYSTTAQPTGEKWINDSPIYRIAYTFEEAKNIDGAAWNNSGVEVAYSHIVKAFGYSNAGGYYPLMAYVDGNNNIQLLSGRNSGSVGCDGIVIEYY